MSKHRIKIYFAITVIIVAVILIVWALFSFIAKPNEPELIISEQPIAEQNVELKHPLNGQALSVGEDFSFFPIAIMIDNSYDSRPQAGLDQADIIYEALAEGNITRLVAIFDSNKVIEKIGPIRSARNYFMDWAEEYKGVYMHVGGSPQALLSINSYDFINVDQIGAGEIYFWRDNDLDAPHNVFSSSANWLRVGEMKEVSKYTIEDSTFVWNFVQPDQIELGDIVKKIDINFANTYYEVIWNYNEGLNKYQREQGGDKFYYHTGEQAMADNIIVQVVDDYLIDEERRGMDTQAGGLVYIFNNHGYQAGVWLIEDGRTRFFNTEGEELKLVPGRTWVEIINDKERLEFE